MTPAYPDFTREEFERRYAVARRMMEEDRLDALLVTERSNYIYFSGHRSCQNPIDKIRSYIFILPKDGDPVLITMPFEVEQVQQTGYVRDVRTIGGLTGHVEFVVGVLESMGLQRARIGCEFGREQYLGINLGTLQDIRTALPSAEFLDASRIFLCTRVVKSSEEIVYLRKAGLIAAQAQADIFTAINAGMQEDEIARRLRMRLFELGADGLTMLCVSSGPASTGSTLLPTQRRIAAGETVSLDVGIEYRGYCADIARTASVGVPSAALSEFYSWMMELREDCNRNLQAGKRPADVVEACNRGLVKRGIKTMGVGRIGHGVGIETTEYPSLASFENIVFEDGMVFACNPNFVNELGFINCEDNWVISGDEPDLLSSPAGSKEIPIIAA